MKIILKRLVEDELGGKGSEIIIVKGDDNKIFNKIWQRELNETPEDAYFFKALHPPSSYIPFIELAYKAGKAGEELLISYEEYKEFSGMLRD